MKIVVRASVKQVQQRDRLVRAYRTGRKLENGKDEIKEEREDLGWFVVLSEMPVALWVGLERPSLEVGDKLRITLERDK